MLWFNNFHTMKHLLFILSLFRNLMYCFRKKALNIKRQRDTLAYIRLLGLFIHRILGIPNLDMYQVTGIIKMKPSFKKRILSPGAKVIFLVRETKSEFEWVSHLRVFVFTAEHCQKTQYPINFYKSFCR